MKLSDENKRRIESLSFDEMAYEINLGSRSRFQREKFAYLKSCYESKLTEINSIPNAARNPATQVPTNSDKQKPNILNIPIGYVWLTAIGTALGAIILYLIKTHFGISLYLFVNYENLAQARGSTPDTPRRLAQARRHHLRVHPPSSFL